MATYNRAHLIEESLHSIANQEFIHFECLVIDDGSSDNTKEVVAAFAQKDTRFKYRRRTDDFSKGLPGSRNYGLSLAIGKRIIFFDDDDIIHPKNLSICFDVLKSEDLDFFRYEKKSFSGSFDREMSVIENLDLRFVGEDDLYGFVSHKIPLASCTVMWKSDLFKENRFREDLMYAEEWELYSRILASGVKGALSDQVLYFARKHPESNTSQFWDDDPKRVKSFHDAHRYLYDYLADNNKVDKDIADFFLSATRNLDMPEFRSHILSDNRLSKPVLKYLKKRNVLFPIRKTLYSLKKKF